MSGPLKTNGLRDATLAIVCVAAAFLVMVLLFLFQRSVVPGPASSLHPVAAAGIIFDHIYKGTTISPPHMAIWTLSVWMMWGAGTVGTGRLLLRPITNLKLTRVEKLLAAFGVGFVCLGLLQLTLGLSGFARFSVVYLSVPLAIVSWWLSRRERVRSSHHKRGVLATIGMGTGLCLLVLLALPALTPPVQSDAVRYHLGAPQEFLKLGSIRYLPLNAFSNFPFLVEMHFMAVMALGADSAANLVHFTLYVATAAGIFCCTRRLAAPAQRRVRYAGVAQGLPAIVYLGTPAAAILATWGFIDHATSFFTVMSLLLLVIATRRPGVAGLWLVMGILLGGLCGTKYTAAVPVAVLLTAGAIVLLRAKGLRAVHRWRLLTLVVVSAGFIGSVWVVKNTVLTGNPVYPLAWNIFGGGDWSAYNAARYAEKAGAKGIGNGVVELVRVPMSSSLRWDLFEWHHMGAGWVVLLAGLAVPLLGAKQAGRQGLWIAAVLTIVGLLSWFFTYQSNRLLLPILAGGLPLFGVLLLAVPTYARMAGGGAAGAAALYGTLWAVQWQYCAPVPAAPPLPYLLGKQSAEAFKAQALTNARAFDYLNRRVKPDEKVLLVGEHRIYGAEFSAVWSDWFDTTALLHLIRAERIATVEELLTYLTKDNVVWVMINEAELRPQLESDFHPQFTEKEWAVFESLRNLDSPQVKRTIIPPGVTILRL